MHKIIHFDNERKQQQQPQQQIFFFLNYVGFVPDTTIFLNNDRRGIKRMRRSNTKKKKNEIFLDFKFTRNGKKSARVICYESLKDKKTNKQTGFKNFLFENKQTNKKAQSYHHEE